MIAEYRGVYTSSLPLPDEALAAFFAAWTPAPKRIEMVPLAAALGRVLARDVRSSTNVPEFPRSAMDGFALRACDVTAADAMHPLFLALGAEVRPGSRSVLPEGTAVRIATGAPLPVGADSVVRIEDVILDGTTIGVSNPLAAGVDVITAGEDIAAGTTLARRGAAISAALLGALAVLGQGQVEVYARPSVALISTGDEVVPIDTLPRAGEVRNSNGIVLAALLRGLGAETVTPLHVRDDVDALERAFGEALETHDALVISGGSSVGARDFTRTVLSRGELPGVIVHGVRMTPGRPVLLAASGSKPIIGLPGNPAAAMVALMAFGPRIFAELCGGPATAPCTFGTTADWLVGKAGWASYLPVRIDSDGGVRPLESFCSTFVSSLVEADGYVYVDPDRTRIPPGELVRMYRLP